MNANHKGFGVLPSKLDLRDYKLSPSSSMNYPEEFQLDAPTIKDQEYISSCVPHVLSYIVEYFNNKEKSKFEQFSTMFIYGNREENSYDGPGMYLRDALKQLQKDGDVVSELMVGNVEVPYAIDNVKRDYYALIEYARPNRIKKYFKLEDINAIKQSLINYGYVAIAVKWYKDIELFGNVIKSYKKGEYGNHALTIYGWNKKGWLIANSWGESFGDNGTAILPFDYPIDEAWGVIDENNSTPTNDIKETSKNQFIKFIYKIINKILNLFKK